jgi:hypothetical protein
VLLLTLSQPNPGDASPTHTTSASQETPQSELNTNVVLNMVEQQMLVMWKDRWLILPMMP